MDKTEMAKRKMSENSLKNLKLADPKKNFNCSEIARKAQIKSVEKRAENKTKRERYSLDDGFNEFEDIQQRAKKNGNIRVELEACIQKNKLNGHFVEKIAQTNSKGEDIPINDLSKVPTETLLLMVERVNEKIDD